MENSVINNLQQVSGGETSLPVALRTAQQKFELACKSAEGLQAINNFGAVFQAANVVSLLREAMTDKMMDTFFMPLMNTKVGFLTDHTGKPRGNKPALQPYSREIVRDAIIDAVTVGLMPVGNQFNIIAERMYPTKEGYTALLKKLGVKYFIETSYDRSQTEGFAEIPLKITYSFCGEKKNFNLVATVKKDAYSSPDQIRGKAERRAKKALYEYLTGCDLGDADASEPSVMDVQHTECIAGSRPSLADMAMRAAVEQTSESTVLETVNPETGEVQNIK